MENILTEQVITNFQKRFAMDKDEAAKNGIFGETRKAEVKRIGKKVIITPKRDKEYIPDFVINDADVFETNLKKYLEAVRTTNIKSTQMNDRHNEKYFMFNVWKNATSSDFLNPEKFIVRYTNFIKDNTFSEFDELTQIGKIDGNMLLAQRIQDDYGFETPYIMHLSLTNGKYIYNLPWIRYGISTNQNGDKIAYIYALQKMEQSSDERYNEEIKNFINKVNTGEKQYRNVTPNAIAALAIFLGMLEGQGIKGIKVPDFLIGRYGRFSTAKTEEETDRIQTNLTNKFLRNFLRLDNQLENLKIEPIHVDAYNSFLCMSLDEMKGCKNKTLEQLYNLGRYSIKRSEIKIDLGKPKEDEILVK